MLLTQHKIIYFISIVSVYQQLMFYQPVSMAILCLDCLNSLNGLSDRVYFFKNMKGKHSIKYIRAIVWAVNITFMNDIMPISTESFRIFCWGLNRYFYLCHIFTITKSFIIQITPYVTIKVSWIPVSLIKKNYVTCTLLLIVFDYASDWYYLKKLPGNDCMKKLYMHKINLEW